MPMLQTLKQCKSIGTSWGKLSKFVGGCLLVGCCLPLASQADIAIGYRATDLADTIPGKDLWQYEYVVSGYPFSANEGFSIYFDFNQYGELGDPPPVVNADWDVLITQHDLVMKRDGTYDALALVNDPALNDPFLVNFVWFGTGTPGAQPFDLYYDDGVNFQIIAQGTTVARSTAITEPTSALLLAGGLPGWFVLRRRSPRHIR